MFLCSITFGAELTGKRTYTSKTFRNADGSRTAEIHIGHIHYDNKLGVGDGVKGLRGLDWNLQWDDIRKGWYFEQHSFQPFLPEFADQWCEFRDLFHGKDQTIRLKPVCNHVKGKLVNEIIGVSAKANAVVYTDAFGQGIDLILCFSRSSFKKLVRIREGYYPNQDIHFDFEIEFPAGKKVYRGDATSINNEVDIAKPQTFTTGKKTLIGIDQQDGKEWFTYIRPFTIWDSPPRPNRPKRIVSKVNLIQNIGKTFLRKNIPVTFFADSQGDVFTDLSLDCWPDAADGHHTMDTGDWDAVHDAAASDGVDTTYSYIQVNISLINRSFFPMDTSPLPDNATISAATFYAWGDGKLNNDNDGDDWLTIVQCSAPDATVLQTADYDLIGDSIDDPTEGIDAGDRVDLGVVAVGSYQTWALNATGIGWIDKTGYTQLGIREGHDVLDNPPAGRNYWFGDTSETAGTANDPKLVVTYTVPGGQLIFIQTGMVLFALVLMRRKYA